MIKTPPVLFVEIRYIYWKIAPLTTSIHTAKEEKQFWKMPNSLIGTAMR